jgi:hypothetical protein
MENKGLNVVLSMTATASGAKEIEEDLYHSDGIMRETGL